MKLLFLKIGFSTLTETSPGVWSDQIFEKKYRGKILSNSRTFTPNSNTINDDISINNRVSIISDQYLSKNLKEVRYVVLNDSKWKVRSIEFNSPRIILVLGDIFNG